MYSSSVPSTSSSTSSPPLPRPRLHPGNTTAHFRVESGSSSLLSCDYLGLVNAITSQIQNLDVNGDEGNDKRSSPLGGVGMHRSSSSTSSPIAIPSGMALHFKRPIFPNLPYSPMSSPSNVRRRCRPLQLSRHVSIENTGQYVQLNQYLLKEPIGQVCFL